MLTLFKEIFTWWNQQTVGTRFTIFFFGKLVGKDDLGNKWDFTGIDSPTEALECEGSSCTTTTAEGKRVFANLCKPMSQDISTFCKVKSGEQIMAYAKYKNSLGAVCVTTGCGGTNAITGLLDAWQDNNPIIFISGNVKSKHYRDQAELYHNGGYRKTMFDLDSIKADKTIRHLVLVP